MSFSDDIVALVRAEIAAAQTASLFIGTVTYDNGGVQSGVYSRADVILDGSSNVVICYRPRHIRADLNSRVVVQFVHGAPVIVAELGEGRYVGQKVVKLYDELLNYNELQLNIGDVVDVIEQGAGYRYDGSGFPGDPASWVRVYGPSQPVLSMSDSTDITGITSATYASGSPVVGVVFTAPLSGEGVVTVNCQAELNSAVRVLYVSTRVREGNSLGSGTDQTLPNNDEAWVPAAVADRESAGSWSRHITGLTAGAEYNVFIQYRLNTAGTAPDTADIFNRTLIWTPDNS